MSTSTIFMPSIADLVGFFEENPRSVWYELEVTRRDESTQDITYRVPVYLVYLLAQTLHIGQRYEAIQVLVNTSYIQQSSGDVFNWSETPGEPTPISFTVYHVPQWIYDYLAYIEHDEELPVPLTSESGYMHLKRFCFPR